MNTGKPEVADSPVVIETGPGGPEAAGSPLTFRSKEGFVDRLPTSVVVRQEDFSVTRLMVQNQDLALDLTGKCWQLTFDSPRAIIWSDDHGKSIQIRTASLLQPLKADGQGPG